MMTRGFRNIEKPDPSDKELTVKIPTSSLSIASNCGCLWPIILNVIITGSLSDLVCYFEVKLIQYKNMHITCTGAFKL